MSHLLFASNCPYVSGVDISDRKRIAQSMFGEIPFIRLKESAKRSRHVFAVVPQNQWFSRLCMCLANLLIFPPTLA